MESIEQKMDIKGQTSKDNNEEKNYANERWENGLTLRKRKINAILSKQRGFYKFQNEDQKEYQIMKESLNIPNELKNKKYDDLDIFLKEMKTYIKSKDIEYIKYVLFCLRSHTLNNDNSNNKNVYSELLIKQDFISDILYLLDNYIDDKQIIYEGLWLIINVLYFQQENYDLILFLSNQQCIQLYIKILDKKDNVLRENIFWTLANLLNNNNISVTYKVLFHLYMSSLFRLYIFKDLEDHNSKLKQLELRLLINILMYLSDFINVTFIKLRNKDIKSYTDYNSTVDYNSILENNNYLFYHSMQIFINYFEVPELKDYCIYGLSKLTNFLDDPTAFNKFFISGICRKLVKEQIKVDDESINCVIQIIGNYLFFSPESLIDPIFLEEALIYFVKLLKTYPTRQFLKRDIFWSASNITAGNQQFCQLVAKSGLLFEVLKSITVDNELVINEALFMLSGFFDQQNIEIIIDFYQLDYMKYLVLCLKNLYSNSSSGTSNNELNSKALSCIGYLFEDGDILKDEGCPNMFVKDFEKNGGFEILEAMLLKNNFSEEDSKLAQVLLKMQNNN